MLLSKTLAKICKDRKITISRLSKLSGVPQPTIHGWTSGRSVGNIDDLKKICDVLQVSLHQLLYDEPDPYELGHEEILKELFSGDLRVTVHKIEKKKNK